MNTIQKPVLMPVTTKFADKIHISVFAGQKLRSREYLKKYLQILSKFLFFMNSLF